ncbi:MAG: hypothetical protein H6742_04365 [Alphaproteobacteria bacterium]|nr:hypothetical protein [Alphaproteobacteria bacterium]
MLLALLTTGFAWAGPVDLVGFGSPAIGRGGGGVALVDGAQTVFRNPATLQDMQSSQLAVGFHLMRGSFDPVQDLWWDTNQDGRVDDSDAPLSVPVDMESADAVWVSLGRPIGGRFGIGFNGVLPVRRLLRIETFEPSLPEYFLLANQAQRFDMALGFGWEQLPGISVGGGVQLISRARLTMNTTLDVTVRAADDGDTDVGTLVTDLQLDPHAMTLDIVPGLAPMASLYWDAGALVPALQGLTAGFCWRGSTGLPVDVAVDVQANILADDLGELDPVGITALVPLRFEFFDHYVPTRVDAGLAWTTPDVFRVYADLRRTWWAPMQVSVGHVVDTEVQSQLLALPDPVVTDGNDLDVVIGNTWSVRAGGEVRLPAWEPGGEVGRLQGIIRAGAGFEPTPLRGQRANTALLDSDRLILAGGLGIEHGDPFGLISGPVSWDVHTQVHMLGQGSLAVDTTPYRPGAPVDGRPLPIGGTVWAAGLQWAIDY